MKPAELYILNLKAKMVCYLNFSSKKRYLELCFYTQDKIEPYCHLLVSEKRKVVKSIRIYQEKDFDSQLLIDILNVLR